ncbi:hypothetical protein CBL_11000 [Carabus blaptoides fortunei]
MHVTSQTFSQLYPPGTQLPAQCICQCGLSDENYEIEARGEDEEKMVDGLRQYYLHIKKPFTLCPFVWPGWLTYNSINWPCQQPFILAAEQKKYRVVFGGMERCTLDVCTTGTHGGQRYMEVMWMEARWKARSNESTRVHCNSKHVHSRSERGKRRRNGWMAGARERRMTRNGRENSKTLGANLSAVEIALHEQPKFLTTLGVLSNFVFFLLQDDQSPGPEWGALIVSLRRYSNDHQQCDVSPVKCQLLRRCPTAIAKHQLKLSLTVIY